MHAIPIDNSTLTTTDPATDPFGVAAAHADDVDRAGRFPAEAISALRAAGLLAATVPPAHGGTGMETSESVALVRTTASACGSAGLVLAMHFSQVACLVEAARTDAAAAALLGEIARDGLLVASATTERATGGDVSRSSCHVGPAAGDDPDEIVEIHKDAPVISYAEHADVVLVTARRSAVAAPTDQVLVACRREQTDLERTSTWDSMGFRGTESHGYLLRARVPRSAVLDVPYAELSARAMLPASHLYWSAAWLGLSDAALSRARRSVRALARVGGDAAAVGSLRLAELTATCTQLEHTVRAAISYVDRPDTETGGLTGGLEMSAVKINASQLVVTAAMEALRICGLAGYQRSGPGSLERIVRDALGAPLMINNDRILSSCAVLSLAARGQR